MRAAFRFRSCSVVVMTAWLAIGAGMLPSPTRSLAVLIAGAPGGEPQAASQTPRRFSDLRRNASTQAGPTSDALDSTELRVQWQAYAGTARSLIAPAESVPVNTFEVISRRPVPSGSAVRERNPELSDDQLVVVFADAGGRVIAWQTIKDPRILRAEQPGADGLLSGRVLYRALADFSVIVPVVASVAELQIYQPRWSNGEWMLDRLGTLPVPPKQLLTLQ